MAAHEQRDQLVTHVLVRRRIAVFVALLEQHDSNESATGSARRRASSSNSSASKRSTATRNRPHGLRGPRSRGTSTIASTCGSERTPPSVLSTASRS